MAKGNVTDDATRIGLHDKSAIVFGGTGTIGAEIVAELLESGCRVAIASRGIHSTTALMERIARHSERLDFIKADVSVESQVKNAFELARDLWSKIDFLVYSPGLTPDVELPLSRYPATAWSNNIDIYVTGFLYCFQESMQKLQRGAHIVAISSAVTRFSTESLPPFEAGHYAACKAALNELCKWGRREAHQHGVLLSRLAPGAVESVTQRFLPGPPEKRRVISVRAVAEKIVEALQSGVEIDRELFPE
jgi:NAD(P)-dependent dehydrogenase (short-subunit alcohol dehydrogenase family)